MIKRICKVCGKEFFIFPSKMKWGTGDYCSKKCVGKYTSKRQLGKNNHSWKDVISKRQLKKMYLNEKKTMSEISKIFKISKSLIYKRMKMWNIQKRSFSEEVKIGQEHSEKVKYYQANRPIITGKFKGWKKNRAEYIKLAKENYEWKCMKCGKRKTNKNFDLIVHHVDGNNKNNNIKNLMVLCQGCHGKIHFKGKIRKRIKLICNGCNKEFFVRPHLKNRKYCSQKCHFLMNKNKLKEIEIKKIEFTNKKEECYDLKVPDNNNFFLENGLLTHNCGKSYLVKSVFQEEDTPFIYHTGHITPLELYQILYKHRKENLIFDDINLLDNELNLNIFKSCLNDEVGVVCYSTTSDKLKVPDRFIFQGTIILLLNTKPKKTENLSAVESRVISWELSMDYKTKIKVFNELAKQEYKELKIEERQEIVSWIEQNTSEVTENLNLRTLFHIFEMYRFDKDKWKVLAKEILVEDEEKRAILDGMDWKEWCEEFQKSSRTWRRYRKILGIRGKSDKRTSKKDMGIENCLTTPKGEQLNSKEVNQMGRKKKEVEPEPEKEEDEDEDSDDDSDED